MLLTVWAQRRYDMVDIRCDIPFDISRFFMMEAALAYDRRKIANSFYLPKHSLLRGIASLLDFTHSESKEFADEILSRSIADDMRADWEAVGADLWCAIGEHERRVAQGNTG